MLPNDRILFTRDAKFSLSNTSVATAATPGIITLKGYPIVWNTLSTDRYFPDGSTYQVRLLPGSASFTNPCRGLYEHEDARLIGNTQNTTLRILPADDIGVPVEIDLPDTTTGRDVATLVRDKYLKGMSFTMQSGIEDGFATTESGKPIVNARKYTIDEVTVCADPAFVDSFVAIKPDAVSMAQKDFRNFSKERIRHSLKLHAERLYLSRF